MAHSLPPLPYDYNALEPHIDEQTMQLHHDKHHAAYVNNLNAALEGQAALAALPADQLIRRLNEVPENIRAAGWRAPFSRRSARSTSSRLASRTPASSVSALAGPGSCATRAAHCRSPP